MSFKEKYLLGLCEFFELYQYIEKWHNRQDRTVGMAQYLGLTPDENEMMYNLAGKKRNAHSNGSDIQMLLFNHFNGF